MAKAVNQPALGNNLHPGANAGRAGANPHQPEVAVPKRFKDPVHQSTKPFPPETNRPSKRLSMSRGTGHHVSSGGDVPIDA